MKSHQKSLNLGRKVENKLKNPSRQTYLSIYSRIYLDRYMEINLLKAMNHPNIVNHPQRAHGPHGPRGPGGRAPTQGPWAPGRRQGPWAHGPFGDG